MTPLFNSILATFIVSLVSLIGVFTLKVNHKIMDKISLFLVSFAAGALLGDVVIHIFPQIYEQKTFENNSALLILLGFLIFFSLEKYLHWRHCHESDCDEHSQNIGTMNLIGDGFHNFIDGTLIGTSFLISVPVGIATTVAIILHEIPQEIGDYAVLIHSGYEKKTALFFNFLSACISILGAIAAVFFGSIFNNLLLVLLPITAGGFIYIGASDLIPELKKETKLFYSFLYLVCMICGVGIMYSLTFLE